MMKAIDKPKTMIKWGIASIIPSFFSFLLSTPYQHWSVTHTHTNESIAAKQHCTLSPHVAAVYISTVAFSRTASIPPRTIIEAAFLHDAPWRQSDRCISRERAVTFASGTRIGRILQSTKHSTPLSRQAALLEHGRGRWSRKDKVQVRTQVVCSESV